MIFEISIIGIIALIFMAFILGFSLGYWFSKW